MSRISFNMGDTVRLKSGGPVMTVTFVKTESGNRTYLVAECVWFDGTDVKEKSFNTETLDKVTPPKGGMTIG